MDSQVHRVGTRDQPAMSKEKLKRVFLFGIRGLPLAGVAVANMLTLSVREHQFLILITLIWLQVFFLFEVFSVGN
jgi:hypothetical protein